MRVLFLGNADSPLLDWLQRYGEEVIQHSARITAESEILRGIDFLVSYNYRHIIPGKVLDYFPYRAVNLHISLLPWNRGADPNIWSFFENSPKGVTIHYIDVGLDTGEVIYQREVDFSGTNSTLADSYQRLHEELRRLFQDHWCEIRDLTCPRHRQPAHYGTYHKLKDKEPHLPALQEGWQTTASSIEQYGRDHELAVVE